MDVTASMLNGRIVPALAALPLVLLLCAFQKPQLPQVIYDGTRHSTLIEAYRSAYARVGMTKMTVVEEGLGKWPDGTVSTVRTYTFACPTARSRVEHCSATFSISASVKDGICRDCRVTRTSYEGDPAAEKQATAQIWRVLGKGVATAAGQ